MSKKTLIIVESPAKAKSISKMIGGDYLVKASVGHIRDLPESGDDGLTPENQFVPKYVPMKGKNKVIAELKKSATFAGTIVLATDLDTEGEAIAWHLSQVLNVSGQCRVTYNEITKAAITKALQNPREIDFNKVRGQEARRAADRIIGYRVSGLLSKSLSELGLSAGRVQSVVLKMCLERERQIRNFIPEEHYGVDIKFKGATLRWDTSPYLVDLGLDEDGNEIPKRWGDKATAEVIANNVVSLKVDEIETAAAEDRPKAPLITGTMVQAANKEFGWTAKKIMEVAQKLFDTHHAITYHRSDSTFMSSEAIDSIRSWLTSQGHELPDKPNSFKAKGGAQEAHECIRPTEINELKIEEADEDCQRLYNLIWKHAVSSQMMSATKDVKIIFLESIIDFDESGLFPGGKVYFVTKGTKWTREGYREILGTKTEDAILPEFSEGDVIDNLTAELITKKTTPPARYNEATIVKKLEAKGIGRPSTFASIIERLKTVGYWEVSKLKATKGKLVPTERGEFVCDWLDEDFSFMEYGYTKDLEAELKDIEKGNDSYQRVVSDLYQRITKEIEKKEDENQAKLPEHLKVKRKKRSSKKSSKPAKPRGERIKDCPKCGGGLYKRPGSKGDFLGCENYRLAENKCTHTEQV